MTIKLQNTAEKSSLLSMQLHFLKLFVQTENADESHSLSTERSPDDYTLPSTYTCTWNSGSHSNFILYLYYHRTF